MMPHAFRSASIPIAVLVLFGCQADAPVEEVPPLQPVSGKVTLDGEPAAGIVVNFMPTGRTTGNGAYAATDAGGNYSLSYRTGDPGVPAGDYIVVFSKMVQPDGSPIPEGKTAADVNAVDAIPERYRQTENPLNVASVPEGGKTFDFDLKSK